MADLARSPPDAPPAAAAEHQSTDPPLCLEGVRFAVTHSLQRCSCFISCPTPRRRDKKLCSSHPTWVRKKATYGLPTLCTSPRMMGGHTDLFSQRYPDKDGDWEGLSAKLATSLCLALQLSLFFSCFSIIFFISTRVSETEKCLQNCCAAPWLWSCMSTLWAPISATMTGTLVIEWHQAPCY